MAESRGERVQRPAQPAETVTVVRHEYGIDKGTQTWFRALVALVIGALGLGTYGAVKPAPDAPPVVPMPCKVVCPGGELEKDDTKLSSAELHAKIHCCEIVTALTKAQEALTEAAKAREIAGKASDKATTVEANTPKVNP